MAVNIEKKPRVYHILEEEQVNRNEIFHFSWKILSNVAKFGYIVLKIDPKGSLMNSLKFSVKKQWEPVLH